MTSAPNDSGVSYRVSTYLKLAAVAVVVGCILLLASCSSEPTIVPTRISGGDPATSAPAPSASVVESAAPASSASASIPAPEPTTAAEPTTFEFTGTFRYLGAKESSQCFGREGFESIEPGAIVRVLDPKGDVVAGGELDQGVFEPKAGDPDSGICTFKFRVPDVPIGPEFYELAIADIGPIKVTAAEAQSGKFNVAT